MLSAMDRRRLATVLYVRGFAVLALGAVGVRWPQDGLWIAIGLAGVIVTLLGIVELVLAFRSAAERPIKSLQRYVALVSIAFGVTSLAQQFAPPAFALDVLAIWLLGHALVSLMVGAAMPRSLDGHLLLVWSALNLTAALLVAVASVPVHYGILYGGAAYTALYGAVQIAAGLRLRVSSSSEPSTYRSAGSMARS